MAKKMGFEKQRITYQDHRYIRETRSFTTRQGYQQAYTMKSKRESWFATLLECLVEQRSVIEWQYEPEAFNCGVVYRKERIYTPDFWILCNSAHDIFDVGKSEVWVEVKATVAPKDVSRLRWLKRSYPNLCLLLVVDREPTGRSKSAQRQRVLQGKASKYVDRVLYGKDWYPKFGIK